MPNTLLKNPVSIDAKSTSVSLSVVGTAAQATAGSGVQPAPTLSVEGTTGQETTGTGETAGAGAHIVILAGAGGDAPDGSTTGAGGSVTINPGEPGSGAGTPGASGNLLLATEGGNVGIGNSTPTNRLDVNGDVRVSSLGVNVPPGENGSFAVGGVQSPIVRLHSTTASSDVYLQNSQGRLDVIAHDGSTANVSITNAGNVGIGTATPGSSLEVNGGARASSVGVNMAPGGTGTLGVGGVASPNLHLSSTTASSDIYVQNSAGRLDILGNDGATAHLSVSQYGPVGVGTTSPTAQLEVAGGMRASAISVNMAATTVGTLGIGGVQNPQVHLSSTTASSDVYVQNTQGRLDVLANDGSTRMSVTNAGPVGIGTTAPTDLLQISKSGNVALHVTNTATNGGTSFLQSTVQSAAPVTRIGNIGSPAGDIRFSPGNSDSISIKANGNFGIGTMNPTAPLDVQVGAGLASPYFVGRLTNTSAGNGPQSGLLLSAPNSSNANDRNWASNINVNAHGDYALFHSSSASTDPIISNTRLEILSNGNIGVGTTAPGSKLHVNGGVQVGAPTGGDKGTGSINIAGDIYKNGTPQLKRLEELAKRIERLEAQLGRKPARPKKAKSKQAAKSKNKKKTAKGRR